MPETSPNVLPLPPRGQALHILFNDAAIECIEQLGSPPINGVFAEAPGSLLLVVRGLGVRLRFRDRSDVARMITALVAIDAHLAGVEASAASALDAALAEAREAPAHD